MAADTSHTWMTLVGPDGNGIVSLPPINLAGDTEAVSVLLAAGARVGARGKDGRTPLHVAATRRSESTIGALLDAGADGAARTVNGETPFDLAEALRGTDAYRRLKDARMP